LNSAYQLGNQSRRLGLSASIDDWSATSLPQRVMVETGSRQIQHLR
jgi:hypothetical protein